jgi:hypothetical protein
MFPLCRLSVYSCPFYGVTPVCAEAMETISPYLELMPRFKRF